MHAFPDAGIPVVQLSINADKPFDYHIELAAKLAPLSRRGVLIVASGNVVHDLRGMDRNLTDVLIHGYAYGSLSMTAYTLDLPCPQAATAGTGAAAGLPVAVPPDNSNL